MELLTHRISRTVGRPASAVSPHFSLLACCSPMSCFALFLLLTALCLPSPLRAQQSAASLEYQVKAAYLMNFPKFVEWPASAFFAPDSPITICVLGNDPFGPALDRMVENERVNGRGIRVRRSVPEANPQGCHVAFISRSEREGMAQVNSRLRMSSVLTVSEVPGFADAGGMIEFVIEDGKVRFYINAAAAQSAGLTVSSRLLRVASAIRGPQR